MSDRREPSSYLRTPPTLKPLNSDRSSPDITPLSKSINFGDLYLPTPQKSRSASGLRKSDTESVKPIRCLRKGAIDRTASDTERKLFTHLGQLPRRPKQLPKLERPESPISPRNIGFTSEISKKYVLYL